MGTAQSQGEVERTTISRKVQSFYGSLGVGINQRK